MTLIKWRDEFSTGISGIDYEHQQLLEQLNTVYALIDKGTGESPAGRDKVIDSLGEIYGSISSHFALEERMMERHGYDQYEEHHADHERLLDEIRDITEEFEITAELDDQRFKQKLNDWFQLHFKTHDSRLHNLANLNTHDHVARSTMKSMIRKAKNSLLHKTC